MVAAYPDRERNRDYSAGDRASSRNPPNEEPSRQQFFMTPFEPHCILL
jgi:hypothetical protein